MGTITGNGTAVTGLGGPAGYGETALPRGDDTFAQVDVSAVFETGFVLNGVAYDPDALFISTDGFVTFGTGVAAMPSNASALSMPFLAIFMADVDTRVDGEAPDSGQIWLDVDPVQDVVTITWDDVGFYRRDASQTNTFQIQLFDRGNGSMDVVYRYEDIDWTTGDLQGGQGGLGGTPAFIGYRAAASGAATTIPASGNGTAELALPTTTGNTGVTGLYVFRIGGATPPIQGSAGNDTLQGSTAADVIRALEGDDWIFASGGADTVDGGPGRDVLDFSAAPGAIVLNLTTPTANTGWAKGLTLAGIETLIGTGFADALTGAGAADGLDGWNGNDNLTGNAGNDSLTGGHGNDTLTGGTGADSLDGAAEQDRLSGGDQADTLVGGAGNDTLQGDADADSLDGGTENDSLVGGQGADTLLGRAGNDTLSGGTEGDLLQGQDGTDTLLGEDGNDTLNGGAGADRLDGGTGTDTADYTGAAAGVRVDLTTPANSTGLAAGDVFLSVEAVQGSALGDTLRGSSLAETLWGGDGHDSLDGMGGANHLFGGTGNDTVLAGSGADTLAGDAGNDRLTGGEGADSLSGGDGNDTLNGGAGADRLDGGAGIDRADYTGASAGVRLDLTTPANSSGWAAGDVLTGIEAVFGSALSDTLRGTGAAETLWGGDGNDSLDGMGGANQLYGGTGNDMLMGGSGADTQAGDAGNDRLTGGDGADNLSGGDGNDTLNGGAGADRLDGGNGLDRADYSAAPAPVTLDLTTPGASTGWALGDTLIGIDIVMGSAFDDRLRGAAAAETFYGGAGNDSLNGMAGNNTLWGDAGNDTLQGGSGLDQLNGGLGNDSLSGNDLSDQAQGGGGLDTIYGGLGDDSLWGQGDADMIFGGAGADYLSGDAGADTLTGGSGADIFFTAGTKGSDTILDYSATDSDILRIGVAGLDAADFIVSYDTVAGLGSDAVGEAFIRRAATGEVLWIIADGQAIGSFQVQSMSDVPYWLT